MTRLLLVLWLSPAAVLAAALTGVWLRSLWADYRRDRDVILWLDQFDADLTNLWQSYSAVGPGVHLDWPDARLRQDDLDSEEDTP